MADAPPPYSPSRFPQQQPGSFSPAQPVTYQLRQIDRKHQILVPLGATAVPAYSIQKNSLPGLFNKRPDMTISRMSSPALVEGVVANLRLDRSGSYPWVPRATISYEDVGMLDQHMALEDFQNWRWTVDIGGVPHHWSMLYNPTSLVLAESHTGAIQATFVYSAYGTAAQGGQEIGQFFTPFNIWDTATSFIEQVFFSACVVIAFCKDMGKVFSNRGG